MCRSPPPTFCLGPSQLLPEALLLTWGGGSAPWSLAFRAVLAWEVPWSPVAQLPQCPGRLTPPQLSRGQGPPCTCAESPFASLSAWWPQQHPTGTKDSVREPDTLRLRTPGRPGAGGSHPGRPPSSSLTAADPDVRCPLLSESRFCAIETPHGSPQRGLLLLCHRVLKAQCGIPRTDLPRSRQGRLLPRARPVSAEPSWSGVAHLAAVPHCARSRSMLPG